VRPTAFETARRAVAVLGAQKQLDGFVEGGSKRKRQEGGIERVGGSRNCMKKTSTHLLNDKRFLSVETLPLTDSILR
jgi:hypothetical protein